MFDEQETRILQSILEAMQSDDYEPGGVYTVGGATGTYMVKSPFNTECEYSLVFGSMTGVNGDGIVMVSGSNPGNPASASNVYGLASGGGELNNAFEGWVLHVASTGASPIEYWAPLGRGAYVYVTITATTGNCFVQIGFRRKLARFIPDKPRAIPHTHNHPQSRRAIRAMYGVSKQVEGFETQYPIPGKPYIHEPIPESSDTENIGYTQRRVARMNKSNG